MVVWKGGRGVKAPYETTHVRIPLAIKEQVEALTQAYKDNVLELPRTVIQKDDLVNTAKKILKQKKSARLSLQQLVKDLTGEDISL